MKPYSNQGINQAAAQTSLASPQANMPQTNLSGLQSLSASPTPGQRHDYYQNKPDPRPPGYGRPPADYRPPWNPSMPYGPPTSQDDPGEGTKPPVSPNPWGLPSGIDLSTSMRDITDQYSRQQLYDWFSGGLEGAGDKYMSGVTGVNIPSWYSRNMTVEELLTAADKFAPEGVTGKEYLASMFHDEDPDKSWYDKWLDRSDYTGLDEDAMRERAQEFADIYSSPQMEALQRQLEQSIADAQAATGRIQGAYGTQYDRLGQAERDKGLRDLEVAVSRGAGRSGVVDHKDLERSKHFATEHGALSDREAAEIAAISNQLSLIQGQVPQQQQQIMEQASRLQAQELQRLQELDYNRRVAHEQDQFMRALQVMDFTQLSMQDRAMIAAEYARIFGKMPDGFPDAFGGWGNTFDEEEDDKQGGQSRASQGGYQGGY